MALKDLSDRNAVLAAMREFDELGRERFLKSYGFKAAKEYYVLGPDGRAYDSKAIVGVAHRNQFPALGQLAAADFNGGDATVKPKLESLGFEMQAYGEDWSPTEVESIVSEYFHMLGLQRQGEKFVKTSRIRELQKTVSRRSRQSIEYKFRNVSSVLQSLGLNIVRGYIAADNVQGLLRDTVLSRVGELPSMAIAPTSANHSPPPPLADSEVPPPFGRALPDRIWRGVARKLDWTAREEANRSLGRSGEAWCLEFERRRVEDGGRADLAPQVSWVADVKGDGTGYDIKSFELDGALRFIEVKTSSGGIDAPFLVSHNEVSASRELKSAFYLYRVFDFPTNPRLYVLRGDLTACLNLLATDYRACVK